MAELRRKLIATACSTMSWGLNRRLAGNLSVRADEDSKAGFLITPTGIAYDALEPADIVFIGRDGSAAGRPASPRPNGAFTATPTSPAPKPAPSSMRTRRSPLAWPACVVASRLFST